MSATKFLVLMLLAVFSVNAALAQELGTVIFEGRKVILNQDGTWKFANNASPSESTECTVVSSEVVPFSICLDPDKWTNVKLGGDHEHSIKHKDHELYMLVISEKLFLPFSALKEAVIENAKNAAGLNKVSVIEEGTKTIDDYKFGQMVYFTRISGIDITYENFYTNFEDIGSLQIVFFAGKDQFASLRPVILQAISTVKTDK